MGLLGPQPALAGRRRLEKHESNACKTQLWQPDFSGPFSKRRLRPLVVFLKRGRQRATNRAGVGMDSPGRSAAPPGLGDTKRASTALRTEGGACTRPGVRGPPVCPSAATPRACPGRNTLQTPASHSTEGATPALPNFCPSRSEAKGAPTSPDASRLCETKGSRTQEAESRSSTARGLVGLHKASISPLPERSDTGTGPAALDRATPWFVGQQAGCAGDFPRSKAGCCGTLPRWRNSKPALECDTELKWLNVTIHLALRRLSPSLGWGEEGESSEEKSQTELLTFLDEVQTKQEDSFPVPRRVGHTPTLSSLHNPVYTNCRNCACVYMWVWVWGNLSLHSLKRAGLLRGSGSRGQLQTHSPPPPKSSCSSLGRGQGRSEQVSLA